MKVKIIVIAVILLISGVLSAQAQPKPCGCADKEALLDLLNQSQMAVQELQLQIDLMGAKWMADGKTIKATTEGVKDIVKKGRDAAESVQNDSRFTELMNDVDCSVKRSDTSSDCLELIQKHFYDVTQKECLASKSSRGPGQPYYEGMASLEVYLYHLIKAHKMMQNFILQMLKSLPKNCRPDNWFGYVSYKKVRTEIMVEKDRKTTYNNKDTYIGTVLVEGGKAVNAKVYASESRDNLQISSKDPGCDYASEWGDKSFGDGTKKGNATFTLNVYPGQPSYELSVRFFPVDIRVEKTGWYKREASSRCKLPAINKNDPTDRYAKWVNAEGHSDQEKLDPKSPNSLEGSKIVKPAHFNQNVEQLSRTTTNNYEIHFRWKLWRLPH